MRSGSPKSGWNSDVRGRRHEQRVISGWRIIVAVCVCAVASLVGASGALAAIGHGFLSSLSEATPGARLQAPASVAVDHATGEVFVGDLGSGYVDVYSASGVYETRLGEGLLKPAGVAVDEASGDVYVADPFLESVLVYEPAGSGGYRLLSRWFGRGLEKAFGAGMEFGEVTGVAVDNSTGPAAGEVYVLEGQALGGEGGAVDVFKPAPNSPEGEGGEGEFLRRLAGPRLEAPGAIAVSAATGTVLVGDGIKGAVYSYSAEGVYEKERKLTGGGSPYGSFKASEETGNVAGVAVDEAGDVYVAEAERHAVSQYSYDNSSGEWKWEGWITTTPEGDLSEPRGAAASGAGDLFVADAGVAMVDRFGAGVVVPGVKTEKVKKAGGGLTRTSAVLLGTINGEGKSARYHFQYGETEALGSETSSQPSGAGVQAASANITSLEAGHGYYYRIVGENEDGANYGLIERFETPPAVEGLETGVASGVGVEGATLTGVLKREGLVTHYYFQYGTTTTYGMQAPEPPGVVPAAAEEKEEKQLKAADAEVGGLSANTVYHYRLVAENEYGTTYGKDRAFTTLGPPMITIDPVSKLGQTGATVNAKINPEKAETSYVIQYGETSAYGTETSPVSVGSGSTAQAVAVGLSGLSVGTTYHYRIVAENQAGTTRGIDQTFTTVPPAPVDATYAADVHATQATLHAHINPLGNDTYAYFQYGTQSCELNPSTCTSVSAPPGEDIGAGEVDVASEVKLSRLQPDTTYHFRALASNALGETKGPERTFTTQGEGSFVLPDQRAWEMVTPSDKGGAPVEPLTHEGGLILAADDGSALTYVVDGALGEEVQGNRSPEMEQVLATRTQSGWSSQDIATPTSKATGATLGLAPEYQFFTPRLTAALVEPPENGGISEPPLAPGVGTQATIYVRDDATGTYLPLVSEANTGAHFGGAISFVSATPDLSHVVISSGAALTGAGSAPGLYEWAGGRLQLVSVRPNGKSATGLVELGFLDRVLTNAISSNGSRVIWSDREPTSSGHLYLRDTTRGQTIQLDAAQGGMAEPGKGWAQFQWASSDGSRVFFTDKQRLTPDSTADPGEPPRVDLYECVITELEGRLACDLKDLTIDHNEGEHAGVQYLILGASEDGTSLYLIAGGVLAGNENGNREKAMPGANNLYALHYDGTRWFTTFIATLSSEDSVEWEGGRVANRSSLTARVSPNGRYLAFMSSAPLTGYDNVDANPAAEEARDEEVFLYDSVTASLRCVSCNPSGARPEGVLDTKQTSEGLGLLVDRSLVWAREGHEHWLAGNVPGWTAQSIDSALFQSRYLNDEGRLYFNSPDDLVPAAENHKEDVYEYEPAGVGGCGSASGGCVSLISGGGSGRESAFIEATSDGSDVFFVTQAQLLPQDTDTAFDIYDARECSALSPCLTPPATEEAPCVETRTCRPAPPAQPIPGVSAATVMITASGNVISHAPPAKHGVEARKTSKPLTRAQRLARGLRTCRKRYARSEHRRKVCERAIRRRYGRKHAAKTLPRTKRRSKKSRSGGHGR